MAAELHLAENPLALHLLLERLEGLIDVIVPDENLHAAYLFGKDSLTLGCDGSPAPPITFGHFVTVFAARVYQKHPQESIGEGRFWGYSGLFWLHEAGKTLQAIP